LGFQTENFVFNIKAVWQDSYTVTIARRIEDI